MWTCPSRRKNGIWHYHHTILLQLSPKLSPCLSQKLQILSFFCLSSFSRSGLVLAQNFVISIIKVHLLSLLLIFFASHSLLMNYWTLTSPLLFFSSLLWLYLSKAFWNVNKLWSQNAFFPLLHGFLPPTLTNSAAWYSLDEPVVTQQV